MGNYLSHDAASSVIVYTLIFLDPMAVVGAVLFRHLNRGRQTEPASTTYELELVQIGQNCSIEWSNIGEAFAKISKCNVCINHERYLHKWTKRLAIRITSIVHPYSQNFTRESEKQNHARETKSNPHMKKTSLHPQCFPRP